MRITEHELEKIVGSLLVEASLPTQTMSKLKGQISSVDLSRETYTVKVTYRGAYATTVELDLDGTDPTTAARFKQKAGLGMYVLVGVVRNRFRVPELGSQSWSLRETFVISQDASYLPPD